MPADTDNFIIAMFALWAGDFRYFDQLLKRFSSPWETPSTQEHPESPEDIIRTIGALRLRQLWQRRGEFKRFAAGYVIEGGELMEEPLILETRHLRSTVWRVDDREFLLQAYLKDLAWQDELFARARREAGTHEPPNRISDTKGEGPSWPFPVEDSLRGPGSAWTVFGNPFMQVELTDMGLLELSALWIEEILPVDREPIVAPLNAQLEILDPPPGH